jgi:hypothetical protein
MDERWPIAWILPLVMAMSDLDTPSGVTISPPWINKSQVIGFLFSYSDTGSLRERNFAVL